MLYLQRSEAREAISYLKGQGCFLALFDGLPCALTKSLAGQLGVSLFGFPDSFVLDDKSPIKRMIDGGEESWIRALQLSVFCKRLKISVRNCVCIGNRESNEKVFNMSGYGITFRGSKAQPYAWRVIDDLANLQDIL